jgi:hypothetical protein
VGDGTTTADHQSVSADQLQNETGALDLRHNQDGNSPQSFSNESVPSYTFQGGFNEAVVYIEDFVGGSTSSEDTLIRFNGDAGSNYNYIDQSGSQTVGDTKILLSPDKHNSWIRLRILSHGSRTFVYPQIATDEMSHPKNQLLSVGVWEKRATAGDSIEVFVSDQAGADGTFRVFAR